MKMKRLRHYWFTSISLMFCLIFMSNPGFADDTCIFGVTADKMPPYIIILLDNGAVMEFILPHDSYDKNISYTPAGGSVFTNSDGYGIQYNTNNEKKYFLHPIKSDLTLDTTIGIGSNAVDDPWWTINARTIRLPLAASNSVDAEGIKDNQGGANFRYTTNYLNWLFYSGLYAGNGSDLLPGKSRFYAAKKAIFTVSKLISNKAKLSIYHFVGESSSPSQAQSLKFVCDEPLVDPPENNTLDPNYINNINNMGTVTYSPLAEGLAKVGGYYAKNSADVPGVIDQYCQTLFAIVVSPGVSSKDQVPESQSSPSSLADYDGDGEGPTVTISGITYTVPLKIGGSTYLDDVATYLYTHDIPTYAVGFQNVSTYTIGFMGDNASNAFLMNTSNNGNGISDPNDPEYGLYHFEAESPEGLSTELLAAVNSIISKTATFTAPVVPVTRTTSGNRIYLAFFKPAEGNFWEGNVTKFGISDADEIVDSAGNAATWPNGAMKEDAVPYWATKDWADSTKSNYIHNSNRTIYTYLGGSLVEFNSSNVTAADLGNPTDVVVNGTTVTGVTKVINYIRGADVLDADEDGDTTENREIITGDVLHSEPYVVQHSPTTTMVYFGANDGMLHAALDSDGTEAWAFIPPDQLPRLKDIVEGSGHQYFVDSSPKVYTSKDGSSVILVCGERKGGTSYFALDITAPSSPSLLWTINQVDGTPLGETWSEPQFGVVKTSDGDTTGTPVFFIGGGYSSNNALGKAVIAIDVLTGAVVKKFSGITDMDYSFPSSVRLIDGDSNGFVDKVYVGDLGGQMWRFGKFTDAAGPLTFPNSDENISNWTSQVIFDSTSARKFFYPPSVTLEKEYDLVFMGTGDREDACATSSSDRIYSVKDTHAATKLFESDLADVSSEAAALPDLDTDQGWLIDLAWASGEKVLAEGIVFYKTLYISTFTPNDDDPCVPGGAAKFYALNYKTGEAVLDFDGDGNPERSTEIGGGIPSKPVLIITEDSEKLLISTGSTNPEPGSPTGAGIVTIQPLAPPINFFPLWWIEL